MFSGGIERDQWREMAYKARERVNSPPTHNEKCYFKTHTNMEHVLLFLLIINQCELFPIFSFLRSDI